MNVKIKDVMNKMGLPLIFGIASLGYLIWVYSLLLSSKKEEYNKEKPLPVSIIIPCYNEDPSYLLDCVTSLRNANGEKQIILVNNNSNKEGTLKAFDKIRMFGDVLVLNQPKQGKRYAQALGLKHATHDIVMFTDSDTIIEKDALLEISKPFNDSNIGGVTGKMVVANKNDTIVTRMLSAMFWTSSEIFRKATGNAGFMQVMPGPLAALRKTSVLELLDDYVSQTFIGRHCNISDDRYLTMRIQSLLGKRIVYTSSAVARTYVPSGFISTWKMVERWKRGMTREVLLQWTYPMRNAKMLFFDTQFNFLMFNIFFVVKCLFIVNMLLNPSIHALFWMLSWLVMVSCVWGVAMFFGNPSELPFKILWSFFYEFFWSFTHVSALLRIRNQGSWSTR